LALDYLSAETVFPQHVSKFDITLNAIAGYTLVLHRTCRRLRCPQALEISFSHWLETHSAVNDRGLIVLRNTVNFVDCSLSLVSGFALANPFFRRLVFRINRVGFEFVVSHFAHNVFFLAHAHCCLCLVIIIMIHPAVRFFF